LSNEASVFPFKERKLVTKPAAGGVFNSSSFCPDNLFNSYYFLIAASIIGKNSVS